MVPDEQSATSRIVQTYSGPALIVRLVELLNFERENAAARSYLISLIRTSTLNTSLMRQIETPLSPESDEWIKKAADEQTRALDHADRLLYNARLNYDPEKIRSVLWNLSRLLSESIGDHKLALIKLLEINELTSEPCDKLNLSIAIVSENIYLTHSTVVQQVRPEVARAVSSKGSERFPTEVAILKAALAVVQIRQMQFGEAADTLLSIDSLPEYPHLFYAVDLVRYMVICVLASHNRNQLKQLTSTENFRSALNLCPESKQAFDNLCNSRFHFAFRHIQNITDAYFVGDPYFTKRVSKAAFAAIQESAFCAYISPYQSVCLKRMSAAFQESVENIQSGLISLIQKGAVQAKVDAERQILFTNISKQQLNAFHACHRVVNRFLAMDTALSLRIAQLRNHMAVGSKTP